MQEYVAWCLRDADGHIGRPFRTFNVLVDEHEMMIPQMADGEVVDPLSTDEPIAMEQEPRVWYDDPEPMDEEVEPEPMDQNPGEDGEIAELGSDVELSSKEELRWYLDPELEMDSEDERATAQAIEELEEEEHEEESE